MSREYLYRGWDGEKMLPPEELTQSPKFRKWLGHVDVQLMQYTGLRDSAGAPVFEGDVVRWDDASGGKYWRVAQVKYVPGFWRFEIIPGASVNCFADGMTGHFDGGSFMYTPDTTAWGNVMEVVGNRFEHPHLLEGAS